MKHALFIFICLPHLFVLGQQSILTDSNLPVLVIETDVNPNNNQPYQIVDNPKVPATMRLIYRPDGSRNYLTDISNPTYLNYDGKIMIETRGSSSQALEKKPYGFSTKLADNTTNNNVSLLGMPEENDWILNSLAFDESMIRDMLSYDLSRNMGNYAPRGQYVEVIINGDYRGVYVLMEKIKRDSKRVNLLELANSDNILPNVSGGYIVKSDKTTGGDFVAWYMDGPAGNSEFIYHYPDADDITVFQANYIESQFFGLEYLTGPINSSIENGYPRILDIPSFIDFMLVAEISSNVDAYRLSTYFHKDRNGKLRAGPVWDYNLTFGNDLFFWGYDRSHTDVWQFNNGDNTGAYFWLNLFNDPTYNCLLARRWTELSAEGELLDFETIESIIDYYTTLLDESAVREQERWGSVSNRLTNVNDMKTWLQERITWISANIGSIAACSNPILPNLVISKIHYNPVNQAGFLSDDLEYIEITNNSNELVDVSGFYFRELGISYQFPFGEIIPPNEKIVLSSNSLVFTQFHGFSPFGQYTRALSNKEYNFVLCDAFGNIIDEVHYFDSLPWPTAADGDGPFLSLVDLDSNNALAENWIASSAYASIANDELNNDLRAFPVPFTDELYVMTSNTQIQSISLIDLQGRVLMQFEDLNYIEGQPVLISTETLLRGVYFLHIQLTNGEAMNKQVLKN